MTRDDYQRGVKHLYEVTILKKGVSARAASFSDFRIVFVEASNPINAQIVARDTYDAGFAFDAKKVVKP